MNDEELTEHLNALSHNPPGAPAYLTTRILAQLPDHAPLDRVFQWLTAALWRSVAAAAVPIMVGFVLGTTGIDMQSDDDLWYHTQSLVYADSLEEYDYDEI